MLHSKNIFAIAMIVSLFGILTAAQTCKADVLVQQTFAAPVVAPSALLPIETQLPAAAPLVEPQLLTLPLQLERRTITNSVVLSRPIGQISDFRHRLNMLRDQITLGAAKGLLTSARAADLQNRYAMLSNNEAAFESQGFITPAENDTLEQQINLLNQDVSNSMNP